MRCRRRAESRPARTASATQDGCDGRRRARVARSSDVAEVRRRGRSWTTPSMMAARCSARRLRAKRNAAALRRACVRCGDEYASAQHFSSPVRGEHDTGAPRGVDDRAESRPARAAWAARAPLDGRNCGTTAIPNAAAFGLAAMDDQRGAKRRRRGPAAGRHGQFDVGRELCVPPRADAEPDQDRRADDVQRHRQRPVRHQQHRQAGATGQRPAEKPDLVADDGRHPRRAPITNRAVQEQRGRRSGKRRRESRTPAGRPA